jgi:hypothetical protein
MFMGVIAPIAGPPSKLPIWYIVALLITGGAALMFAKTVPTLD